MCLDIQNTWIDCLPYSEVALEDENFEVFDEMREEIEEESNLSQVYSEGKELSY